MKLGDFKAGRQPPASPAMGAPGGQLGVKDAEKLKPMVPHSAPASFDFFCLFSFSWNLYHLGNGTVKETEEGRGMGTQTERRDVHGNGLFIKPKRFYFLWILWKLPSQFVMRLLGAPLEEGFPDAAMIWSAWSRVRRIDHGSWPIIHPHGWTKRPSFPVLPLS